MSRCRVYEIPYIGGEKLVFPSPYFHCFFFLSVSPCLPPLSTPSLLNLPKKKKNPSRLLKEQGVCTVCNGVLSSHRLSRKEFSVSKKLSHGRIASP